MNCLRLSIDKYEGERLLGAIVLREPILMSFTSRNPTMLLWQAKKDFFCVFGRGRGKVIIFKETETFFIKKGLLSRRWSTRASLALLSHLRSGEAKKYLWRSQSRDIGQQKDLNLFVPLLHSFLPCQQASTVATVDYNWKSQTQILFDDVFREIQRQQRW